MVFDNCFVTDSKLLHYFCIFFVAEKEKVVLLQPQKSTIVLTIKRRKCFKMIIVPVKEGESIDRALKRYKRKYEKTGVVKELRARQQFTKPSVIKRAQLMKAIYVQKLRQAEENM